MRCGADGLLLSRSGLFERADLPKVDDSSLIAGGETAAAEMPT